MHGKVPPTYPANCRCHVRNLLLGSIPLTTDLSIHEERHVQGQGAISTTPARARARNQIWRQPLRGEPEAPRRQEMSVSISRDELNEGDCRGVQPVMPYAIDKPVFLSVVYPLGTTIAFKSLQIAIQRA